MRWRPRLRPDPAGAAHDAPPDPLVGWGEGHPSQDPTLGAFGASILAPAALVFQPEPYHFLKCSGAYDHTAILFVRAVGHCRQKLGRIICNRE